MPYDPRMLQMARAGVGMMGPQQGSPFANAPPQQREWWDQPQPAQQRRPDDQSRTDEPPAPKHPPSLLDMMMSLGRMSRPEYDKAVHGAPPGQQQGKAMVSPWAWLGSMGGGPPR